ncbi:MAG: DUF1329 domain-containing protein [Gammaproteobacteria bacterium]|jgi:hypothetical protein
MKFPYPLRQFGGFVTLTLIFAAGDALAVSYDEVLAWVDRYADAPTDGLAPGPYGNDRVEDLAAYLPVGYVEEFDFAALELDITPTANYGPHPVYIEATEKFAGTASIGSNGSLEGYTAGRAFSPEQILSATPEEAGFMVAWNHIRRWQNVGYRNEVTISYLQPTADGSAGDLLDGMHGGGHVDRHLSMFYHRVYLSGLASKAADGYRLDVDGSDQLLFKEYIEMLSPFDIAGLKLVVERPLDQSLGDQVNSYLPTERRVRRLSSKERSDSWLGTNWTLDDFEGYSGLAMDNDWRFIGRKVVLHVASSRNAQAEFHGPTSTIPLDRWQLRPCYVVEAVPRWQGHPYGRRLLFIDQQTYSVAMTLVFDRSDTLTRVMTTMYEYSDESDNPPPELSTPRWRASIVINKLDRSANIAAGSKPTEFVDVKPSRVRRLFSVSNLTGGR